MQTQWRDPVARDQPPRELAIPARHEHHGRAGIDRAEHAVEHAGDVEHRHHAQAQRLGRAVAPLAADRVGHQGAMGVHAALGQTGRARGVGQQRQVVGRRGVRAGHALRGERIGPADVAGRQLDIGPKPGFHRRRRRVGLADRAFGHGVGEAGDQHPAGALRLGQRRLGGGDDRHQVGGADDDRGFGVGDVVAELIGPVHRVHRHHHRIGAQGRVERDRELRAVLHEEGDAVALAHAFLLQPAGQRLGLANEARRS